MRTMANLTEQAAPARSKSGAIESNYEAIIAIVLAIGGLWLPLLFPVALFVGRAAMKKGFAGARHRVMAVVAYSIGWIGTAFWVVLLLMLAVGTVIGLGGGSGGGMGGGGY